MLCNTKVISRFTYNADKRNKVYCIKPDVILYLLDFSVETAEESAPICFHGRHFMKLTIIAILTVFVFVLPGYAATTVYDADNNPKYRIDDEGFIYNSQGKLRARIVENKVYDNIMNRFWFRIEGDKIFNRKNELKYRVVGHQVVDVEGKLKYYIKGKPLAEIKLNTHPLQMQ